MVSGSLHTFFLLHEGGSGLISVALRKNLLLVFIE